MNNIIINHGGYTFMRINKTKAKGVYNSGKPIAVVPHKMQPFHPYTGAYFTDINQYENYTFEQFVNSFEYYNCGLPETGKYAAYYIPVVESENGYIYDDNFEGV